MAKNLFEKTIQLGVASEALKLSKDLKTALNRTGSSQKFSFSIFLDSR